MKADGAWERMVQASIDHANGCRGALADLAEEWRHQRDALASRDQRAAYLARAISHATQLVGVLERLAIAPQEENKA